ncbi:Endonuclease III [Paracholeplasma brassicae]|uniref:Endonuclease III n=2 Tax=Acholeplasma brassicae TaxID=61635 RepID=U4KR29_9MOLU|nr:Endonuclease III [Paracholeplasma brassicae]
MKIDRIIEVMNDMFPDAKAELTHDNAFELLVAVVLSAQTTDKAVNLVTPILFDKYPTPELLMNADYSEVCDVLKTIGLYKNKAKFIIALAKDLVLLHNGEVPNDRTKLEALPGVGRKTANVVLSNAFNVPAIAVDTHVARISVRLGLAKKDDNVLEIEQKLMRKLPKDKWMKMHHQMIFFGRYHCLAKKPKCSDCPLKDICKYEQKNI